jgi:V8-like Glu-specific endopeptidase
VSIIIVCIFMTEQLQVKDIEILSKIIADLAFESNASHDVVFRDWLRSSNLPIHWIQSFGQPPADIGIASRKLITSFYVRGKNTEDPRFNTLGSILFWLLSKEVGFDKASIIAAVVVRYNLVHDEQLLNDLIIKYQVPQPLKQSASPKNYGPDIVWQEPIEEIQLQGWFNSEPEFLDVGFLMRGIQQAASVCRIETLDGRALGTGFLVSRNLLLTNFHVLQGEGVTLESINAEAQNLLLRFGYFTTNIGKTTDGQTFRLEQTQPVVQYSPTEKLDYVLLRVEDKISNANEVKQADCDFAGTLSRGMGLTVLQHPEGESMKLAVSRDGITSILHDSGLVQYATKTAGGSSGSPCFNEEWKVVALHHAERSKAFGSIREGILLSSIYQEIKPYFGGK